MSDFIEELAKSVTAASKGKKRRVSKSAPSPRGNPTCVKAMGAGGVLFDFGGVQDPSVARFNRELNRFSDTAQQQVASSQRSEHQNALINYVNKGEQGGVQNYGEIMGSHLSGDTDKIIKKLAEEGNLDCNSEALEKGYSNLKHGGETMQVGGEEVHATSETDAAVMEMMKNGNMNFEEE